MSLPASGRHWELVLPMPDYPHDEVPSSHVSLPPQRKQTSETSTSSLYRGVAQREDGLWVVDMDESEIDDAIFKPRSREFVFSKEIHAAFARDNFVFKSNLPYELNFPEYFVPTIEVQDACEVKVIANTKDSWKKAVVLELIDDNERRVQLIDSNEEYTFSKDQLRAPTMSSRDLKLFGSIGRVVKSKLNKENSAYIGTICQLTAEEGNKKVEVFPFGLRKNSRSSAVLKPKHVHPLGFGKSIVYYKANPYLVESRARSASGIKLKLEGIENPIRFEEVFPTYDYASRYVSAKKIQPKNHKNERFVTSTLERSEMRPMELLFNSAHKKYWDQVYEIVAISKEPPRFALFQTDSKKKNRCPKYTKKTVREWFLTDNLHFGAVAMVTDDDKILGVVIHAMADLKPRDPQQKELVYLKTRPDLLRKGIASAMVQHLLRSFKRQGAKSVVSYFLKGNVVEGFYKKNGFRVGDLNATDMQAYMPL